MCISALKLGLLPFVGYNRRSRAWDSDFDVASGDPFALMLFGLYGDYHYGVSQGVRVEEIDSQPFPDCRMCLRTVAL